MAFGISNCNWVVIVLYWRINKQIGSIFLTSTTQTRQAHRLLVLVVEWVWLVMNFNAGELSCWLMGSNSAEPKFKGSLFTFLAERSALSCMLNTTNVTARFAQRCLRLSGFELDAMHRNGIEHQTADLLISLRASNRLNTSLQHDFPVLMITKLKYVVHWQLHDTQEADIFSLQWPDDNDTEEPGYKHTPSLQELPRIADNSDVDHDITTFNFFTAGLDGANCQRKASSVDKRSLFILTNDIVYSFDKWKPTALHRRSYYHQLACKLLGYLGSEI